MQHRLISAVLCAGSLLGIGVGYLLYHHPDMLGLCAAGTYCLTDDVFYGIASPLYLHSWPLLALFLLTAFLPSELFYGWAKFFAAISIIPLLLVIGADPLSHSFFPGFPDRPQMTEIMVKFVVLTSLVFLVGAYVLRFWKRSQTLR